MTQLAEKEDKLSKGVGFATLKPTFPDASAQLVELMRATLRHAQEITAAVGEAEGAAERALSKVQTVDSSTTAAERRVVDSEIDRLTTWLNRPPPVEEKSWIEKFRSKEKGDKAEVQSAGQQQQLATPTSTLTVPMSSSQEREKVSVTSPPPVLPPSSSPAATGEESTAPTTTGSSQPSQQGISGGSAETAGSGASFAPPNGAGAKMAAATNPLTVQSTTRSGKTLTSEMAEEIETTVMWVQQLLESVHFVESDEVMEPGASLLGAVQPGRRHQKEIALSQSVHLLHEKKEEEEDAEDETAVFRSLALQTVSFQRSNLPSRE